jgi:disulfide bond formation protein DsbB
MSRPGAPYRFNPLASARDAALTCAAASGLLLLAALGFEYLGGLLPCQLCIWQRWPHLLVILAGLLVWKARSAALLLAAGGALASAAIALYHVGVAQAFWPGPKGCSASLDIGGDLASLTDRLLATPVVRCDEIAWSFLGLSMAGWYMVASLAIAALALQALVKAHR